MGSRTCSALIVVPMRRDTPVILLTGGTKQRQQRDIAQAKELWADYKWRRKPPAR
jgi:putative component of toxin-antitoxin plasmid stabilization module